MKRRNPPVVTDIKFYARKMRTNQTIVEEKLWEHLRNRQLSGYKFRRQHPKGRHILDFYCHEAKLAIELDGGTHDEEKQKLRDNFRTTILEETGITLIRFRNHDVLDNIADVLNKILASLQTLYHRERVTEENTDISAKSDSSGEG